MKIFISVKKNPATGLEMGPQEQKKRHRKAAGQFDPGITGGFRPIAYKFA